MSYVVWAEAAATATAAATSSINIFCSKIYCQWHAVAVNLKNSKVSKYEKQTISSRNQTIFIQVKFLDQSTSFDSLLSLYVLYVCVWQQIAKAKFIKSNKYLQRAARTDS